MIRLIRFFYRGPGVVLVIVGLIITVGWFIQRGREKQEARQETNQPKRDLGSINPKPSVDKSQASKEVTLSDHKLEPVTRTQPDTVPVSNPKVFTIPVKPAQQMYVMYVEVSATPTPTPPPAPSIEKIWLPPSSFIPCVLVNTVESSHINTPVVGEVLEDIYENGKLVIAAGTIASSFAQSGAVRDRIEVAGEWLFVFHDGRQLKVNGIACVRQADPSTQQFGMEDGSAGLQGELVESDHWANAKAFLALLITNTAQVGTGAVNGIVTKGSGAGTVLPDTSSITSKYLDQLLNGSTGDARFVRVTSGTEFYIFPSETVLPLKRSIENSATTKELDQPTNSLQSMEKQIMQATNPQPTPEERPRFKY